MQWTFSIKNKNWIIFLSAQQILFGGFHIVCDIILREKTKIEIVQFLLLWGNVPLSRTHLGGVGNWVALSAKLGYISYNIWIEPASPIKKLQQPTIKKALTVRCIEKDIAEMAALNNY